MPKSIKAEFDKKGFDDVQWNKYFRRYQQEYIRKRLRAIKLFAENNDVSTISNTLSLNKNSVYIFLAAYLKEGFQGLCRVAVRPKPTRLTTAQELLFKQTIVSKSPFECDLEGNIWTGELMRQLIKREFAVDYKSGIYDLLDRLNLSHQKAHSDYQNADKDEQLRFLDQFKQTLLASDKTNATLTFDEFSISSKPSNYYGWAERNTRPRVKTDEKNESAPTDC
ncbi:MAG: winged helix-turn-helix domain-containing protein [Acidobacteria bacterium]|jgi:transposase|nr:winged helix-turn-helix domain-containing protein [Acidobacteriota bacterium]